MVPASCGPDPGPCVEAIRAYQEADFDFLATQVLPQVRGD